MIRLLVHPPAQPHEHSGDLGSRGIASGSQGAHGLHPGDVPYGQEPVKPKIGIPQRVAHPEAGGEPHTVFCQEENSAQQIDPPQAELSLGRRQALADQPPRTPHQDGGDDIARVITPAEKEQAGGE